MMDSTAMNLIPKVTSVGAFCSPAAAFISAQYRSDQTHQSAHVGLREPHPAWRNPLPLPVHSSDDSNPLLFSLSLPNWKRSFGWTAANTKNKLAAQDSDNETPKTRIGIVGGGICGVSVAHALAQKLLTGNNSDKYDIVVLEGDPHSAAATTETSAAPASTIGHPPPWLAATARNANSIVPGAAMHVFSHKSVVWKVLSDTAREWYFLKKEDIQHFLSPFDSRPTEAEKSNSTDKVLKKLRRNDDFAFVPPYFALHAWKCLGPSVTSDERWSFLHFVKEFLYRAIWLGDEAANERGRKLVQLAQANRHMFLSEVEKLRRDGYNIESTQGFMSIHRDVEAAKHAVEETKDHGEEARLLEWQEAIDKEPRLKIFPVQPLHAVERPNERISNCEEFIRAWTHQSRKLGVGYRSNAQVQKVEALTKDPQGRKFRVHCTDGDSHDFDIVVLAAGIHTPLMAAKLGVPEYVPTYPLRGFSMTLFAPTKQQNNSKQQPKGNLLAKSFSFDSMYCTSVTPYMARWAGFGEFVGFRNRSIEDVPSIGPSIMQRYAEEVFPGATGEAVPCFRPLSPDDLPLAGPIKPYPGLYVHTGHGTLGWTVGLATGECLAQAIVDESLFPEDDAESSDKKKTFELPDGSEIDRETLYPSRFTNAK